MEYKYRMLCPFPYSNQSIQFKLSQAYLQSCTALSPNKRDSLTYTVSMETIQDQDYSPLKPQNSQFLRLPENGEPQSDCKKGSIISRVQYDLNSHQPIISIRIQSQSRQLLSEKTKNFEQSHINLPTNVEQEGNIYEARKRAFQKKSILKINNLDFNQTQVQPVNGSKLVNFKVQSSRKSIKMGKVMSRIHSQMKEQQTIRSRRRATSGKTIPSPVKVTEEQRSRARSFDKIQNYHNLQESDIYRTLNDKINEQGESMKDMQHQILNTQGAKNSILGKTNSSSNICYSPELVRRKSDIAAESKSKVQKCYKYGDQFATNRLRKETSDRSSFQSNENMIRQRIRSSIVHKSNHSKHFLSEIAESYEKSLIFKSVKNKQADWSKVIRKSNGSNHIKPQKRLNDTSLQIIALKFNLTDRNSVENQSPHLKKKSISHQDKCNNNTIMKFNIGENKMENQKQNSICKELNNVQIDTKNMMEGVCKNKRVWKRVKDNAAAKLFRL